MKTASRYTLSSYGPTTASVISPHATEELVSHVLARISERCGRAGRPATDAWVSIKIPRAGTTTGLRALVTSSLNTILQNTFDSDLAEQSLDELGSRVVQEIPPEEYHHEEHALWMELERVCATYGGNVDELLDGMGKSRDDLGDAFRIESEFQVRARIGLDALAAHLGLTISGTEEMLIVSPPSEREDRPDASEALRHLCLRRKALRCACASANLEFRPPDRLERHHIVEDACDTILGEEHSEEPRFKLMRGGR